MLSCGLSTEKSNRLFAGGCEENLVGVPLLKLVDGEDIAAEEWGIDLLGDPLMRLFRGETDRGMLSLALSLRTVFVTTSGSSIVPESARR